MGQTSEDWDSDEAQEGEEDGGKEHCEEPLGHISIALRNRVRKGCLSVLETNEEQERCHEGYLEDECPQDLVGELLNDGAFDLSQQLLLGSV